MTNVLGHAKNGDCLIELEQLGADKADLVYLDPPFFTNRRHTAITRDRASTYSFNDAWSGLSEYAEFMEARLRQIHRVLKDSGSVFVHCDSNANFLLRVLLDEIFGPQQFRSEIIWTYKRWSNAARNLLPAHQTIFFYSKSDNYKFNIIYGAYSETTNVDQILQLRQRDEHGVSKYATDAKGEAIYATDKKGVPLSDVWEIPFLNPKAKERTGYPTQKPVLLLDRIIRIATEPGDLVVDPFCGSGTTLVAAAILGRRFLGIDTSNEAVELANDRIKTPTMTESALLKKGRVAYATADLKSLALLEGLDLVPVHRNAGIDAFLKSADGEKLIPIRVQRTGESLAAAASLLAKAAVTRRIASAVLVRTEGEFDSLVASSLPAFIHVVDATALRVKAALETSGQNADLLSSIGNIQDKIWGQSR